MNKNDNPTLREQLPMVLRVDELMPVLKIGRNAA